MSDRSLSIFDDDPEDNDMPDETDVIETADGDAERTQVMPAAPAAPLPQRRPAQDSTPTRRGAPGASPEGCPAAPAGPRDPTPEAVPPGRPAGPAGRSAGPAGRSAGPAG